MAGVSPASHPLSKPTSGTGTNSILGLCAMAFRNSRLFPVMNPGGVL